ncbi:MAG: recombination regulator RecX, partial [Streptococcus mitis]|nr:recombination regulator RecX [Streptococcus mitis]
MRLVFNGIFCFTFRFIPLSYHILSYNRTMKITKLEKKKRLYLMELDNGDKCYITEDTIVRFMLSRDKVISEEELKEIQDFAKFSYGKNLALYHLSFKA